MPFEQLKIRSREDTACVDLEHHLLGKIREWEPQITLFEVRQGFDDVFQKQGSVRVLREFGVNAFHNLHVDVPESPKENEGVPTDQEVPY